MLIVLDTLYLLIEYLIIVSTSDFDHSCRIIKHFVYELAFFATSRLNYFYLTCKQQRKCVLYTGLMLNLYFSASAQVVLTVQQRTGTPRNMGSPSLHTRPLTTHASHRITGPQPVDVSKYFFHNLVYWVSSIEIIYILST